MHYILDKPGKNWTGLRGFVTKEVLEKYMPSPKDTGSKILVCGPPGMMAAISGDKAKDKSQGELSGALKALGYSAEQVFKY